MGLLPGEIFVHRNVANLVIHTDINCLSVLQYAVEISRWSTSSSAATTAAAASRRRWKISATGSSTTGCATCGTSISAHAVELDKETDRKTLLNRLCELNIQEQVLNVANTTTLQDAWGRSQGLAVHGWVYDIRDGLLRDLGVSISRKNRSAGKIALP